MTFEDGSGSDDSVVSADGFEIEDEVAEELLIDDSQIINNFNNNIPFKQRSDIRLSHKVEDEVLCRSQSPQPNLNCDDHIKPRHAIPVPQQQHGRNESVCSERFISNRDSLSVSTERSSRSQQRVSQEELVGTSEIHPVLIRDSLSVSTERCRSRSQPLREEEAAANILYKENDAGQLPVLKTSLTEGGSHIHQQTMRYQSDVTNGTETLFQESNSIDPLKDNNKSTSLQYSKSVVSSSPPRYAAVAEISLLQEELHSAYTEVLELTNKLKDLEEESDSVSRKYLNAQVAIGSETEKWRRERFELEHKMKQLEEENCTKTHRIQQLESEQISLNRKYDDAQYKLRRRSTRDECSQTKSDSWIPQQVQTPKGIGVQTDNFICIIDHKGTQTLQTATTTSNNNSQTDLHWDSEIINLNNDLSQISSQLKSQVTSTISMKQKLVDLHGDSAQLIYMQDTIRELATLFNRKQDEYNVILEDMKKASMDYKSWGPFIEDSRAFYTDYIDELETELRLADKGSDCCSDSSDTDTDWGHCKKLLMTLLSSHATLRVEKRCKTVVLPSDPFNRHLSSVLSSITRSVKRLTVFKHSFNRIIRTSNYCSMDSSDLDQIISFLSDAQKVVNEIVSEMPGDDRRSIGAGSPSSPVHRNVANCIPVSSKSHTRYPMSELVGNRLVSPMSSKASSGGTPKLQNFKKPADARPVPPPSFYEPSQLHLPPGKSLSEGFSKSNSHRSTAASIDIWRD